MPHDRVGRYLLLTSIFLSFTSYLRFSSKFSMYTMLSAVMTDPPATWVQLASCPRAIDIGRSRISGVTRRDYLENAISVLLSRMQDPSSRA
ncbi:hypothetical protein ASPTUDRAFT_534800 [Aspergillus tubingensis CBS 134.48]|uniref:Uncharacterized protein n=1 Tax=Aspergillus tubingensis (strain CBS 134.48) TaxID=767770 RepID=A0A1L9N6G9_ASPTC|nr:hypothetical protein ASPTUDRAFT_534800 [Aspergillus tubingensis CBS 134.48]